MDPVFPITDQFYFYSWIFRSGFCCYNDPHFDFRQDLLFIHLPVGNTAGYSVTDLKAEKEKKEVSTPQGT